MDVGYVCVQELKDRGSFLLCNKDQNMNEKTGVIPVMT